MPNPTYHRLLRILLLVVLLIPAYVLQLPAVAQAPPLDSTAPPAEVDAVEEATVEGVDQPTTAPVRDPFFGIVQSIHDPESALAAGSTWERLVVWWSAFQPNGPDEWQEGVWPTLADVAAEQARGIEVVGVVLHTPPWAARNDGDPAVSPPHNLELPFDDPQNYWGQFMMRLAREYAGAIDTWIVWNEPEFCWTGTIEEYAQLQKVAYQAIKAGNPNATVVLTGTTYWMDHEKGRPLVLERLLAELAKQAGIERASEAPGDGALDAASAPPNDEASEAAAATDGAVAKEAAEEQDVMPVRPEPPVEGAPEEGTDEEAAEDEDASAPEPPWYYFDAVAVHQYGSSLNSYTVPVLYRRILTSYGIDVPLWFPESNMVPHDDPLKTLMRGGLRGTMEEQAAYMIQSVALARAAGVERYSVYKMRDEEPENDQYYGLVRNDGSPRPAYYAYQTAVREMSGVRDAVYFWSDAATPPTEDEITALLASTAHRAQFVWPGAMNGVRMRRGNDRVTVLWNASAAPLEVGVPSSAPVATLMDKYGQPLPLTRGTDGAFRITLAAATNNTDARDPSLILVGGDPVILVEPGAANLPDPYPRPIDVCWGVPGALVWPAAAQQAASDDGASQTGSTAVDDGHEAPGTDARPLASAVGAYPAPGEVADGGYPAPPPTDAQQMMPARPASGTDEAGRASAGLGAQPAMAASAAVEAIDGAFAAPDRAWVAPTGYTVAGPWLDFFDAAGGVEVLGYPRSPVVADPEQRGPGGQPQCVQYFQRMVLEWHPHNPPEHRIQRRLLGAMTDEAAPPTEPVAADGPNYRYYPHGAQGLGHAVSNTAPDGTDIGFKTFFDRYGGEATFGYPMEPPTQRTMADGATRWTQRFQAALFEHHAEFDVDGTQPESGLPWRTWRVQLGLLGDEYLKSRRLPFIVGDPAKHVLRPPEPTP